MLDFLDILDNYANMGQRVGHMRSAAAIWWAVLIVLVLGVEQSLDLASAATPMCTPTALIALGQFYEPNAPERDSTGQGDHLGYRGGSARDCHALEEPGLKWWSCECSRDYDAVHRATQQVSSDGHYHYSTDFPGRYPGRPPHSMYASPRRTPYAGHSGLSSTGTDSPQCGSCPCS